MTGQIRSELLKVRTTRTVWALTALAVGFVALSTVANSYFVTAGVQAAADAGSAEIFRSVLASISTSGAQVAPLCLGILLLTAEFRHNTITATLLAEPRREVVVAAKVVAILVVGAGIAVAATVVGLAIALPWLGLDGVAVPSAGELPLIVLGNFLVLVLYGLLGLGLGTVVRNQVVAVVVGVVFVTTVEPLLVLAITGLRFLRPLGGVAAYLPGEAASALQRTVSVAQDPGALHQLPMLAGGLVLLGYGLALLGLGTRFSVSRDIT
ncbi:MAG TPA: ABC transporter permease subunit [Actinomycetes bacterium]|nr:ABC transporter permease subunit [Actinomycetes bacterium]